MRTLRGAGALAEVRDASAVGGGVAAVADDDHDAARGAVGRDEVERASDGVGERGRVARVVAGERGELGARGGERAERAAAGGVAVRQHRDVRAVGQGGKHVARERVGDRGQGVGERRVGLDDDHDRGVARLGGGGGERVRRDELAAGDARVDRAGLREVEQLAADGERGQVDAQAIAAERRTARARRDRSTTR